MRADVVEILLVHHQAFELDDSRNIRQIADRTPCAIAHRIDSRLAHPGNRLTLDCHGGPWLQWQQAAHARRLLRRCGSICICALVARPLSWRPLSVGQAMQVQPADVAVGYRLAVGRKQWLVYRSLPSRATARCWAII